jgi:Entner-Doudoroff aldolase
MAERLQPIENARFGAIFGSVPLMAILRGMGAERSLNLANTAWNLGIDVIELPIQSDEDIEALRVVAAAGRDRGKVVGAGTIVSPDQVHQAMEAGAGFTVSPGLDLNLIRETTSLGIPTLPGVATPSEVQCALREGLTWLKAFPASVLGGDWLKAMKAPFPQAIFVATGGMNVANARSYLEAGARVIAVGSALEDETQLPRLAEMLAQQDVIA